jgi:tricorn protease
MSPVRDTRFMTMRLSAILLICLTAPLSADRPPLGYYRFPALSGDTIVFTAEGDLWRVAVTGGVAQRLTTHAAQEVRPAISPDGLTLAYSASYEGPTEIYTLPLAGGVPERRTWDGGAALVVGWTPAGDVLYATRRYSGLPDMQLYRLETGTGQNLPVPLAQASDGTYDTSGRWLFFTRLPFQGSHTRRYKGGTAQQIWKFSGNEEAVPLTRDYAGTSKSPMFWNGRVYFVSDRDGTMNIWSMTDAGRDLRQHTRHTDYEVQSPSLSRGRIAYQHGASLRLLDLERGTDALIPISLVSDFDQVRERWVKNGVEWITAAHLSPSGDRVALTARGQVFVAPALQGRLAEVTRNKKARYRNARFMPDGGTLVALSDETDEVEFWRLPADGLGTATQLTTDGKVLRWDGVPSPDGGFIAHHDKDRQLWVLDVNTRSQKKVAAATDGDFDDLRWSPDGKWLAYTAPEPNQMTRLFLYEVGPGRIVPVTTDRYDSFSPTWSPDGKWLYFLSDRHFESSVPSPWGSRQPEPFFDKQTKILHVALKRGERSPFDPDDELAPKKTEPKEKGDAKGDDKAPKPGETEKPATEKPSASGSAASRPTVVVDAEGLEARILEVPVAPGNYSDLDTDGKRLYVVTREAGPGGKRALKTVAIDNKKADPDTFLDDIRSYELSLDGKKLLLRKNQDFFVVDAGAKAPSELVKSQVPLKDWMFRLDPREEWRQMFVEAWRLERDYFYDRGMHGVDWPAVRAKYLPLVDRVTDRDELSDLLAQMVSELSALHIFVYGGDLRDGQDEVEPASLGGRLTRDTTAGGYRVSHIYQSDPDIPAERSPLARPNVEVRVGDVIEQVNGVATLSAPDISALLRGQAGKQVRLRVKPAAGGTPRDVVVVPIRLSQDADLRYDEWEYTRRLSVEKASDRQLGYVHLRAMGAGNMSEWQREFYPVFNREGLIIDVRHNRGGNIDSWLLARLLRRAWFYWQPRVGHPYWNMQYAFRGHIVVLCDEFTASDGEAFAEGFRRLGLGKIIGTRTWGGEIWLSSSNLLVDRGIATSAEFGVYGPEGEWLIEGHGVEPDIVVDNPPHATFKGQDAQLDAAIKHLQELIKTKPVPVPPAPPYPVKRGTN